MSVEATVEAEDLIRCQPTLRIPLSKEKFAIIDVEDYHLVAAYTWHAKLKKKTGKLYAASWDLAQGWRKKSPVWMHRLILGVKTTVDHRNGNGLDNRRANLRMATNAENTRNRGPSGARPFKGVSFHRGERRIRRYGVHIRVNGKSKCLGYFDDPKEAARTYDRAAREHFGAFAWVNFPEEKS